ncbi:MAG: methyltransferase [Gammaproteobacteria bacterium HGW-Gammaproteobacteria-1]|nr:MAG: methyltransferase [Gammaproteobacteria bacterium HGW-Gammaproteobacteria-1]
MNKVTRPVLRYHGGKWRIAPWIISHFPAHRVYVEPYGGGASVLLRKQRAHGEVYNDLDDDVVNLFRVLREDEQAQQLRRLLELTPFSRTEWVAARIETNDPIEAARRLIVRSMMGYGSAAYNKDHSTGFRSNAKRSGSTPPVDFANKPAALIAVTQRLCGVTIENKPAVDLIRQHDGEDVLFYVDPPYVHQTRAPLCNRGVRQRYRHEMSDDDHRALADVLNNAAGMVVLSGYQSPLYDDLYSGWWRTERTAMADGGIKRMEALWLNKAARTALRRTRSA